MGFPPFVEGRIPAVGMGGKGGVWGRSLSGLGGVVELLCDEPSSGRRRVTSCGEKRDSGLGASVISRVI